MDLPPLAEIERAAWERLQAASTDPASGLRYVTLATVDASAQPQARMVVLRRVDSARRLLEFHTDIRSPKWVELAANPKASVLGYDTASRLQLRLTGQVARLTGPKAQKAWDSLPPWTRATHAGGPPGDALAFGAAVAAATTGEGLANFGVLRLWAASLDWFQLLPRDNRRALFTYDAEGSCHSSRWIAP